MFIHNLTVALRNLTKYKTQSIVSILGLAAGFACFSLTAMWIRYENSFDDFHPKGDRIYRIVYEDKTSTTGYYVGVPAPLAADLKKNIPEVEETALVMDPSLSFITSLEQGKGCNLIIIDSGYINMFDLPRELFKELNPTQPDIIPCAITQSIASDMLCDTINNVIGMHVEGINTNMRQFEIRRILPDWKRTEIGFTGLVRNDGNTANYSSGDLFTVYVLLKEGVDENAFIRKLKSLRIKELEGAIRNVFTAIPLHDLHKKIPGNKTASKTKYQHIRFFALAGTLVILSALFNYLVLFITRLKMRGRELALRKVNGATNKSLMKMLLTEFGLVLFIALLAGEYLVKIALPFFQEMSRVKIEQSEIYQETFIFAGILYIGTILLCTLPIYYYRTRTLNEYLHGNFHGGIQNVFQKVMMTAQLVMSSIMILSTAVIFMQMSYQQSRSIGCNIHNVYDYKQGFYNDTDLTPICNAINTFPFVQKAIVSYESVFPINSFPSRSVPISIEDKEKGDSFAKIRELYVNPEMFDLLEIHLLDGRIYHPEETNVTIINESAQKLLGSNGTIGRQLNGHTIVGVVDNFYLESPLVNVQPTMYSNMYDKVDLASELLFGNQVIIKFKDDATNSNKKEVFDKMVKVGQEISPDLYKGFTPPKNNETVHKIPNYPDWSDGYNKFFLTSEKNLAKLFSIVSIICLLISIFGIYSLASLTCEQRRKEIAIRKINGATMKEILNLFFKEFFILLGIALVIAFPIGYYVMHLWLEQYSRQVPMGPLLFLGIALALALVIVLTIIFRVWRAASANPAQVIKENN